MGLNQRSSPSQQSKRSQRHQISTVANQVIPSVLTKMSGNPQRPPRTNGSHRHLPKATLYPHLRSRLLRRRPTPPNRRALSSRAARQTPSLSVPARLAPQARLPQCQSLPRLSPNPRPFKSPPSCKPKSQRKSSMSTAWAATPSSKTPTKTNSSECSSFALIS